MKTTVMVTADGKPCSDTVEDSYVTQNVINDEHNALSSTSHTSHLSSSSSPSASSLDINLLMDTSVWPINTSTATNTPLTLSPKQKHTSEQNNNLHPLESNLTDWNTNSNFAPGITTENWILSYINQPMDNYMLSTNSTTTTTAASNIMPQYPNFHSGPSSITNTMLYTPTIDIPLIHHHTTNSTKQRRDSYTHHRAYNRRSSSHPSVASVVSLTAHEPVSKMIDGIEYITFLYSHDRLVKEYAIRTDIDNANLNDIVMDFRTQNAVSRLTR